MKTQTPQLTLVETHSEHAVVRNGDKAREALLKTYDVRLDGRTLGTVAQRVVTSLRKGDCSCCGRRSQSVRWHVKRYLSHGSFVHPDGARTNREQRRQVLRALSELLTVPGVELTEDMLERPRVGR